MSNDLSGTTIGQYKVLRKLGSGGMATVYKAHEMSLNRVVALKVIGQHLSDDPSFIERFQREAQAAARLSHPNIVQIYSIGEEDGVHYFSMEYVKGRSVQEILRQEGHMTAAKAVPIVRQVAEALGEAHEAGIVHRDIKPANIMIDTLERVKVADFGIAQMASAGTRLTREGLLVGTPEYVSPEQCRGDDLDGRTDIYSLGVTFYEMLSGRTPFEADTPAALIMQITEGRIMPIGELNPTVPEEVQQLVARMIHKDRDQRFQSAEDLVATLESKTGQIARPLTPQPQRTGEPVPPTVAVDSGQAETRASGESAGMPPTEVAPAETREESSETVPEAAQSATEAVDSTPAETAPMPPGKTEVHTTDAAEPVAETPGPATAPTPGRTEAVSTEATTRAEGDADAAPDQGAGNGLRLAGLVAGLAIVALALIWLGGGFAGDGAGDDLVADDQSAAATSAETAPDGEEQGSDEGAVADTDGSDTSDAREGQAAGDGTGGDTADGAQTSDETGGMAADPEEPDDRAAEPQAGAASGGGQDRTSEPATSQQETTGGVATGGAAGGAAADRGDTGAAQGDPAATQPAEPVPPGPSPDAIVITAGDDPRAPLLVAWVEEMAAERSFEVIDYPSVANRPLEEVATYHLAIDLRVTSTETLRYFGESTQQTTAALTARVIAPDSGRTLGGPVTETVKYTSVNAEQVLEAAINRIARPLLRDLR